MEGWFSWLHYVTDTPPPELPGTWPVYGQGRDVTWMGIPDDADYRSASFSVAIMCHRFTPLRTFQDASKTP